MATVLDFQLQHQSFQWIFQVVFILDWLVWSPLKFSPAPQFKSISSSVLSLLSGLTLTSMHDYWKNHSFDYMTLSEKWDLFFLFFNFFALFFFNFTILYWFCHTSTWISHRYTCVPHPEPSSLLPLRTIPLGHPSASTPSIQYRASNLDWQLVSWGWFGRMALKHI